MKSMRTSSERSFSRDAAQEVVGVASKVIFSTLPAEAVDATKRCVLDALAVALAGTRADGAREVAEWVKQGNGRAESRLVGVGIRVPAPEAALANSTMGHALDYDDTYDRNGLHCGVPIIFALLAFAEKQGGVRGKDFIMAATLGLDLGCRMSTARKIPMEVTGWHISATCGIFGATLACAKLAGLTEEGMLHALGIAYSQAAGNIQAVPDGALVKRMQPGLAARGSILAVQLAQSGLTGPLNIFEGKYGFFNVYERGSYDRNEILANLGERFMGQNISFKPYPCCRCLHAVIDAVRAAVQSHGIRAEAVRSIEVSVGPLAHALLTERASEGGSPIVDAQFSIPYTVARTLITGSVRLVDFSLDAISDPNVRALMTRVSSKAESQLDVRGGAISGAKVIIRTQDERVVAESVPVPLGHPKNPMSLGEHQTKFRECALFADETFPTGRMEEVIQKIDQLESLASVEELLDGLVVNRRH